MKKVNAGIFFLIGLLLIAMLSACNPSKYVPTGKYLLDEVKIELVDSSRQLSKPVLNTYVSHQPNHKMLWSARFRLGIYNLGGSDTTRWWNRWMHRLGEAPVIFDSVKAANDASQLQRAMQNAGYLSSSVEIDSIIDNKKRRIKLHYKLNSGNPHTIRSIEYSYPNDTIEEIICRDSALFAVQPGENLDLTKLELQRDAIVEHLRNSGYYAFTKEYITFNADTAAGSMDVDLTMRILPPKNDRRLLNRLESHRQYIIRNVKVITDFQPGEVTSLTAYKGVDSLEYKGIKIINGKKAYLKPNIIYDNCFLKAGQIYSLKDVNATYSAFGRLGILKFINVRMIPAGEMFEYGLLDAYILLTTGKSQSFSAELEGTNSEGNFGVATVLNYSHHNIFKGSETLNTKLRGAYEALNGSFHDIIHNRYLELGGEVGINFPKFEAPFLKESFKRSIKASTEFNVSMNYQERPEYTRLISTAGWSYKWIEPQNSRRHIFTPIDINYVYLPESTYDFLDQIAPDNPLLRYSYEDHFIMRLGYSFYQTNKQQESPLSHKSLRDIYTIRVNAEVAGNLLFAINSLFTHRSDFHTNPYKVFGINYSQYAKVDADFSYLHIFNQRNSMAFHVGAGVGVPYANSTMLPFEKRFYGGGANGVRGWDVRTLGPGRFPGNNSVSDFIHQCGDIRLDFSVEYRPKLFWILEGALFIDAGNIWTIRNYPSQPEGVFRFNSFYKQLAAAYGAGIRLDFNYFLIRFDMGMKAHDPAINREPWPIIHPNWKRDHSFHFSIGYPF